MDKRAMPLALQVSAFGTAVASAYKWGHSAGLGACTGGNMDTVINDPAMMVALVMVGSIAVGAIIGLLAVALTRR